MDDCILRINRKLCGLIVAAGRPTGLVILPASSLYCMQYIGTIGLLYCLGCSSSVRFVQGVPGLCDSAVHACWAGDAGTVQGQNP